MIKSEEIIPFPFASALLEDVHLDPDMFDRILKGEGEMSLMEYGFCITSASPVDSSRRYVLFFQRKPYSAGNISPMGDLHGTGIREFFIYLAQNPQTRLSFIQTDPVLLKSILVLQERSPETEGAAEHIKIETLVVGLMEGRKDSLVALIQDGRFSLAFVKGGKAIKAYFSDQVVQSSAGMDWIDLFKRIEISQMKGNTIRIRVFENLRTTPAADYLEGKPAYQGGILKHYTRPMPEIIIRDQTRTLKRVSVTSYPFVIGRDPGSDLFLNDPGVSRKHASLGEKDGKLFITDMGSLNGILVNDQFTRRFALQDGDRITLGSHILQIVLPRSPAEDISLFSSASGDATMAMDRNARIKITCPECGTAGAVEASKIYRKKRIRFRCPKCGQKFAPTGI